MFCNKCGTKLVDNVNFCSCCGQAVSARGSHATIKNKAKISQFNVICILPLITFIILALSIALFHVLQKSKENELYEQVTIEKPESVNEVFLAESPISDSHISIEKVQYEYKKAYLELVQNIIDEFGLGDFTNDNWPDMNGVYYAELIDFDNNGEPELFFAYSSGKEWGVTLTYFVYGFQSDEIELLATEQEYWGGNFEHGFSFATDKDGTRYVCNYHTANWEGYYDYYTIFGGKWTKAWSRNYIQKEDSKTGERGTEFFCDDEIISVEYYLSEPEIEILGMIRTGVPFDAQSVTALIAELE